MLIPLESVYPASFSNTAGDITYAPRSATVASAVRKVANNRYDRYFHRLNIKYPVPQRGGADELKKSFLESSMLHMVHSGHHLADPRVSKGLSERDAAAKQNTNRALTGF